MRFITIGLIIVLCFVGLFMFKKEEKDYPSTGEQLVDAILSQTAEIIQEKYDIKLCGMGAAMPGGPIQQLTLCFDAKHSYAENQLRMLLLQSAQELLSQINGNKEIQGYLKVRPFTIKNIEILIFNHDKKGLSLMYPEISVARISYATLIYRSIDPENDFKYKNEFQESYEDALKIVQDLKK